MNHIFQSLLTVAPIIFVLILGYYANKKKAFGDGKTAIPVINKLVLSFALPASLFVGTVSVNRSELINHLGLFTALLVCLVIAYVVGFALARKVFKRNMTESAIAGLAVSFAAGPFYGPALLGGIYGDKSNISISLITLILNIILVPLATLIIKLHEKHKKGTQSPIKMIGSSLFHVIFKTPFVWAPLLAFVFVLCGIHVPSSAKKCLELIGHGASGIALFVAGMNVAEHKLAFNKEIITIVFLKNLVVPIFFAIIAIYLFSIVPSSDIFNEGILLAALPSGPIIVLLSTEYKQYQREASSVLTMSAITMIFTVIILISILNI